VQGLPTVTFTLLPLVLWGAFLARKNSAAVRLGVACACFVAVHSLIAHKARKAPLLMKKLLRIVT
jgi:hypothetical protein